MNTSKTLQAPSTKNALPPRRTTDQETKKKYCGECPVCKALLSLGAITSPHPVVETLKKVGPYFAAHRECAHGFLEQHYGHIFTQNVFSELSEEHGSSEQHIKRFHVSGERSHSGEYPSTEGIGLGSQLDPLLRSTMESRFGQPLDSVRVHTDSFATRSSAWFDAHAYTYGNDIFFASGKYQPQSPEGKKLLAHELVHVVQHRTEPMARTDIPTNATLSRSSDPLERHASALAASVMRGESVAGKYPMMRSPAAAVMRKPADEDEGEKSGWFVEKAAEFAANIPGFILITFIIGKNPITNKPVERTPKKFIEAVVTLIPSGEALYKNLNESGAIDSAFAWLSEQIKALNLTWEFIKDLFKKAWDAVSIWKGFEKNLSIVKNTFAPTLEKLVGFAASVGKKILQFVFEGALRLFGAPVEKFMAMLNKAGDAISLIVADPIKFLKNLLAALGKGFNQFKDNILEHLKAGLMGWLTGALENAGIELPKTWDLKSTIGFILQLAGITKAYLRAKAVKVIGERNVEIIEKVWDFVSRLISDGIGGLWEMLKEYIGNLKDMVFDAIKEWVVAKIVTAAVLKIVSMFNPVGAIITAIQTIYNTVMFFIERIQQIIALVDAIFSSILAIAQGSIDAAANWVEKTMARTIPVIISFLARLIGLGGISDHIKKLVDKARAMIDKAVDKVIDVVVKKVKAIISKIFHPKEEKPMSPEVKERWDKGMLEIAQVQKKADEKPESAKEVQTELSGIKTKYNFKRLQLVQKGASWVIRAEMSPGEEIPIKITSKVLEYKEQFEIPAGKEQAKGSIHAALYVKQANDNKLFHEKRERRTGQVGRWKSWVKSNLPKNEFEKAKKLGMDEEDILRPQFNKNGKNASFDIDHIVEYQLEGADEWPNYWMLDSSTNRSAGVNLKNTIAKVRKDMNFPDGKLIVKNPSLKEPAPEDNYWTRDEISSGKHIEAFKELRKKKK